MNRSTVAILAAGSLWGSLSAAAPSSPLKPGTYVYEGGAGSLTIKSKAGKVTFEIETVGGNAHTCALNGEIVGNKSTISDDTDVPCTVRFDPIDRGFDVTSETAESCRNFCGVRAVFDGKFVQPTPECEYKAVEKTRAQFQKLYDKKKFAEALALLEPALKCEPVTDRFTVMWIRNDLAVTHHALKDDAACLKVLEPLKELSTDEDPGGAEPSMREYWVKVAKATRYNFKLCMPKP